MKYKILSKINTPQGIVDNESKMDHIENVLLQMIIWRSMPRIILFEPICFISGSTKVLILQKSEFVDCVYVLS